MLITSFIIASAIFLATGGGVLFLCMWNYYQEALYTLAIGVVMAAIIGGASLSFSKTNQKMEANKMEENYITIGFTEEEVEEILADYYGIDLDNDYEKEQFEDEKASISEYDLKTIILSRLF